MRGEYLQVDGLVADALETDTDRKDNGRIASSGAGLLSPSPLPPSHLVVPRQPFRLAFDFLPYVVKICKDLRREA